MLNDQQSQYVALPLDQTYFNIKNELNHLGLGDGVLLSLMKDCCLTVCHIPETLTSNILDEVKINVEKYLQVEEEDVMMKFEGLVYDFQMKLYHLYKSYGLMGEVFQDIYKEIYYSRYYFFNIDGPILYLYDFVQFVKNNQHYEDIFK